MNDNVRGNLYEPLEQLLAEHDAVIGASEFHGLLVGTICAQQSPEQWLDTAKESLDVPGEVPKVLTATASELFQLFQQQLSSRDYQFQLVLPPLEVEMPLLIRALSDWVAGFLAGFASVDLKNHSLSEDCKELLQDLAAISQLATDDQAAQLDDLIEILEYVRVAVFNVYEDIAQLLDHPNRKPVIH